jgi:hypothetical protein
VGEAVLQEHGRARSPGIGKIMVIVVEFDITHCTPQQARDLGDACGEAVLKRRRVADYSAQRSAQVMLKAEN